MAVDATNCGGYGDSGIARRTQTLNYPRAPRTRRQVSSPASCEGTHPHNRHRELPQH